MYTPCLLLVALILSAFPPGAQQQRGAPPMRDVTIVERLRSELRSVLVNEASAEDVRIPATRLYAAPRAIETPDGLLGARPTLRLGSSCWWLWLLSGVDVCS